MHEFLREEGNTLPLAVATAALGLSRATVYRSRSSRKIPAKRTRRVPPRKLTPEQHAAVVEVLHQEEFVDQPPYEIVATLLDRGVYLASVRTFYRILLAMDELRERRAQRRHPPATKPSLTAQSPNEVWTWDITKLAGPVAGVFYYVYVLLDLFSRYVVGWMVAERENGPLAAAFLQQTIAHRAVDASALVVHNDRGSPMTSHSFVQLCAQLGVTQSYSRPRVSDDNPYSEAQFKTLKYQPDYPERFGSLLHAQGWLEEFFSWHNEKHHHAGLAAFTPADVYFGRVEELAKTRQQALDAAYAAHPERFVKGPPVVRRPPATVSINPTPANAIPSAESAPQASLRPSSTDVPSPRAQPGARAPKAASDASKPLRRASTGAPSTPRRAKGAAHTTLP